MGFDDSAVLASYVGLSAAACTTACQAHADCAGVFAWVNQASEPVRCNVLRALGSSTLGTPTSITAVSILRQESPCVATSSAPLAAAPLAPQHPSPPSALSGRHRLMQPDLFRCLLGALPACLLGLRFVDSV